MIKEIILHVGIHKTATSSIQHTLYNNRELLIQENYLYPESWGVDHNGPICMRFFDYEMPEAYEENAKRGSSRAHVLQRFNEIDQNIKSDISKTKCEKVIISAEGISVMCKKNIIRVIDYLKSLSSGDVKIKIVLCTRDRLKYEASGIQNRVTDGIVLEDAITNRLEEFDFYKNLIEKFLQISAEYDIELSLYKFEEALSHRYGPVGHFLGSVLGIKDEAIDSYEVYRENDSFSQLAIELISFINTHEPFIKVEGINLNRSVRDIDILKMIEGPKFELSSDQIQKFINISLNDYNWLKRNTGIKYELVSKTEKSDSSFVITDEIALQIINSASLLNEKLRLLVIDFFKQKIESGLDEDNHTAILYIVTELTKFHMGIEASDKSVNRLAQKLGIDKSKHVAEIYRDIAVYFEEIGEIDVAKLMMEHSLRHRPQGPYIKDKYKQYCKMLNATDKC